MKEDKPNGNILPLIFIVGLVFIWFIPSNPNTYDTKKVTIDSVATSLRYQVLPDKVWTYYTKAGVFTSNHELGKVGDSVSLRFLNIKQ